MTSVKSRILQFQTADSSSPSFTESLNNNVEQTRKVLTVSERIREINKTENGKKSDGNCEEIRRKSVERLEVSTATTMTSKKTSMSINLTPVNGSGIQSRNNSNSLTEGKASPSGTKAPEFSTIKLKSPAMRSPIKTTNSNNNAFNSTVSGGLYNRSTNGTAAPIVAGRTNRNESSSPVGGVVLRRGDSKSPESVDWKERFEESEKRRLHVVTLAQKGMLLSLISWKSLYVICITFFMSICTATRDYEELRRRYQDSILERERMSQKLQNATVQLEALRNGITQKI